VIDSCTDRELVVPLEKLRIGAEGLVDADSRRVACVRQREL
jgi:hypothetical protein